MEVLGIIAILVMALLGAPIFVALFAIGLWGFYMDDIPPEAIIVSVYNKFAEDPLLYTIPLFTLAGFILAESHTSRRVVRLSRAILGWFPGGLAVVALSTCAFFTVFTGASGVTIIAIGGLLLPALIKEKYPERFSLGLLTSSGSLGLLFPPALPLILYGVFSQASIGQLFAAGILPGFLLVLLLAVYSVRTAKKARVPRNSVSFKEALSAVNEAKWEIFIPIMIMVGIFGGFITLGEIATITVAYALIIEVFIYKDITIRQIPSIMNKAIILCGAILLILGAANAMTNYIIDAEIPTKLLDFMQQYVSSRVVFLLLLNIFLLVVGCLLDIYSAIAVVTPLILPVALAYGVNPVHLGIIMLTNLEIGYSTPPVGMNLFIASSRFDKSVLTLYRSTLPFLLILFAGLMLITYVPEISMWLVEVSGIQ
ncbi:MAG: TRAP transporter large permease subunit [Proteobacteria bacterium]|nr:TRAP transporter large permease subunit [Pseudomonadota bacterium]